MKICINCLLMIEDHLTQCPHCGYTEGVNPMDYCHLPPRTVLNNRYILGRPLGSGGFGVTYIAWDTVLDIRVAIKEYMPGELAQRTAGTVNVMVNQSTTSVFMQGKRSFIDESLRLARLGDIPGVVKIFDCFEDNFTAYIVMEFLEGETLLSRIEREGKLSCEECLPIMVKVLEALEKIHAAGLMHRDIAPDNIMLCRDSRVCLIDFGAARHMTTRHSRSLSTVLKIGYAPAEQYYKDGNQGSWTDVYAVGATMYHALTGVIPIDAYTRANNDTLAKPTTYAHIPHDIEVAILNAMNVTVEKRTQTARELADQLTGEEKPKRIYDRIRQTKLAVSGKTKALLGASIAAVAAVLTLIIIGVPKLVVHRTEAKVPDGMSRVPAVQSTPLPEAERVLSDSDLRLRVSELIHDDYFDRDIVLYQNPSAGSVAYIGSMVDVTVSAPEETVPVPDVMGFEGTDAADSLREAGFEVVTREEYSDTFAPGSVMYQSVAPEETVKPGSVIELVISLGPENSTIDTTIEVSVPNVTGMTFDQAQTALLSQNLYIKKEATEYSTTVPAGQVIRQSPSADQPVNQGDIVSVVVSAGKQTATVPDVRYYSEAAARAKITANNLSVSVNYEESTTVSSGLVIRQDKTAGTSLNPGDTVTIWVSTGYQVSVPNCVGKTQSEAISALTSARLAYYVTTQNNSTVPAGQIMSQSVAAGQKVEQGTTVTLTVSSGTSVVSVTGVSVSPTKLTMNIGDSYTLAAVVKPSDATTSAVTWKSDNTFVADVSASGIVTAKGAGTAVITVTTTDGGKTASCTVTVSKALTSISIVSSPGKTVYFIGNKLDKSGLSVQAAYNDGSVADVTGKCTISGFDSSSAGTKTVTVSYTENGVTRNATFTVVISAPLLSSITVNSYPTKTEYYTGDTLDSSGLSVTAYYTDGSSKDVTDRCVLSGFDVSVEGTQTLPITISYSEGSITKTASYIVGKTAPFVMLSHAVETIEKGNSFTIECLVFPSGSSVTWSSSAPSIASVSGGTVTGKSVGSAIITASITCGGRNYTNTCEVMVTETVIPTITLSTDRLESESKLVAVTTPANASVSWSSGDTSTMTVASDGTITAKRTGVTVITASFNYNGTTYTAQQEVTAYLLGDLDFDSRLTTQDSEEIANLALKLYDDLKLPKEYFAGLVNDICDVNRDGRITTNDAILVAYAITGEQGVQYTYLLRPTNTMSSFSYSNSGSNATITDYSGSDSVVIIPSVIDGCKVTTIADYAFHNCRSLQVINLPSGLSTIGSEAFSDCSSLLCITIPESVTRIGSEVFDNCHSLTSITVNASNPNYASENGVVFNKSMTTIFHCPGGKTGEYTIPSSVKKIERSAFSGCKYLTRINIPYGVTEVEYSAFYECSALSEISIPDSVTCIGTMAFFECDALHSITIPDSVTSIRSAAFQRCSSLSSIVIPDSITALETSVFRDCENLSEVVLPDSLLTIGESTFENCKSLRTIAIPDSVTKINSFAFYGCTSLDNVTIPSSVARIYNYAFKGCSSLTNLTIEDGVENIGNEAFMYTHLSEVEIPGSVRFIGDHTFSGISNLSLVKINNGVTEIRDAAFSECSIVYAAVPDSVTKLGICIFDGCDFFTTIYCNEGTAAYDYAVANGYSTIPYDQYPG